ncbi:RagB/SusD family nutrient uptake outer membrane protein [Flammeovirga agarivorans]|uniref:RagB/SusD family nutrient uptake outer membrane protein n=1 Tax=Flammeovirga agarivorans TaxID=2726742 RepID=A0A7X8SQ35_9BACT|nr:RagB/SusD family nutrient uptake outer membrane protein [Flammeovirga agarivorans]NLR94318.1 RagB/SusD family nutrient uptake outer membrane protein [Flammeovirga agarivorans]
MKTKNILKVAAIVFGAWTFTACESQLDLKPVSAIGDNGFYTNTDEVEAAVFAIYDGLQNTVQREFALTEMRSDNTKTKNSEGEWAQFEKMDVSPTNGTLSEYWTDLYNVVFRANKVIASLDVVTEEATKAQFESEAKFARALMYFNLTRAYGEVPLVTRVIVPGEEEATTKTATNTVYQQIEQDLMDAIEVLPSRGDTNEGRATKGAAQALLAKVKLTTGDYAGAKTLLETVMNSGDYALVENYSDVFYSELNTEIIFAIQFINDNAVESQDFSYEFTKLGRSSGLNYVTADFKANVDPTDTERMAVLYNPEDQQENGKFLTSSADNRLCGNDWIVLRMADVYLMYAEAILAGESSTTNADAVNAYNMIRARVGLSTLAAGETLTKDALLAERRVELAFENHRLFDLVRFGEAENVMGDFAEENGFTFNATKLLLPIPQREIDTSYGLLTQNPGY